MPTLHIDYSPELEIERVKSTLEKLDWYNERKYRITLLPRSRAVPVPMLA